MSDKIQDFFPEDDFEKIKNLFEKKDTQTNSSVKSKDSQVCDKSSSTITQDNNEKSKKKRKISEIVVNKFEGFLMFAITIIVLGVVFACVQWNSTKLHNTTNEKIGALETQIKLLQTEIQTLETKLELYITDENKKPINITLNIDGVDKELVYNPEDGSISEEQNQDNVSNNDGASNSTDNSFNDDFDTKPFLGVGFNEETLSTTHQIGLPVDYVYQYSPAYFAGMDEGDIIISINNTKILDKDTLDSVISNLTAEDMITIQFAKQTETGLEIKTASQQLTYRGNFELSEEN